MKRRTFTNEYKHQVAKKVIKVDNTSLVARKQDISPVVVGRCVKNYYNNPAPELQQQVLSNQPTAQQPTTIETSFISK